MALSVGAAVVIAGMQSSAATEQHSAQEIRFWNGQTRVITPPQSGGLDGCEQP
jgi:hypothetical protein